jgi:membrane dipeptidase
MKNLLLVLLISILIISCKQSDLDVEKMHAELLTIDTHIDIPIRLTRDSTYNLLEKHPQNKGKTDFPRMDLGGLDAAFFVVWTAQKERDEVGNKKANEKAHQILDVIKDRINSSSEKAELAYSTKDIININNIGKHPILIGMENGYPIGNDILQVEHFYNLGIRYLTLCHTKDNDICDSSTDESEDEGLTEFGVKVVNELNRLGIIVDVSHISDKAFYDVIKHSKTPVIASHSNVRSLCSHPRNMTDDMIKLLAKNGGVIHINFVNEYVITPKENVERDSVTTRIKKQYSNPNTSDAQKEVLSKQWDEINVKFPTEKATLNDVINHIDYVVNLVGIEHVGIGSDFDGGGSVVGIEDASKMSNITKELFNRGYSKEDIQKIWSGNFMRVFKQVEDFAKN